MHVTCQSVNRKACAMSIPEPLIGGFLRVDRWAGRWGWAVVALLSVLYYSLYFDRGLNLGGEGGTTAVIALRLLDGQRPIVDTFLGYNVLWFYPVAGIFKLVGPDFMAMKAFFFGLCVLTSLCGWLVVWRVTGCGLLALGTGILLALIPGMLFRNYMGLLGVGNQLVLVSAFLLPKRHAAWRLIAMALSGLVLGLTYLIRIEVGLLMSVIWFGLLVLCLFRPEGTFKARFRESVLGGVLGVAAFAAVHAPIVCDAAVRGYAGPFLSQYTGFIGLFRWEIQKQITKAAPTPPTPNPIPTTDVSDQTTTTTSVTPAPPATDGRRLRPALQEIARGRRARDRYFAAAVYLPIPLAALLVAGGLAMLGTGQIKRRTDLWNAGAVILTLTGCALTLFPQYYFFRPDTPHLVEFMLPFLVSVVCAWGLLGRFVLVRRSRLVVVGWGAAGALLVLQVWVHVAHAFPKESSGSIAARKHGPALFVGANNVRARLKPERAEALQQMHDVIVSHSTPADWVVCLPYSPTINFMVNRPSYLWDMYTDNTLAGEEFDREKIAEILKYQPAAIVIDHRAINNSEESRFPHWAPGLYAWIQERFTRAGIFDGNEVFLRRSAPPVDSGSFHDDTP